MRTFLRFGQVVAGGCAMAAAVAACTRSQAAGGGRVPVTVARAERRAVPYTIGALGTVEPISTVAVTSQVSGMLLRVRFYEGDEVTAGQVLFEIDPRPYRAALTAAQASLARDLVEWQNADRDAQRYRELVATNGVTQEDYQQKVTAAAALAAAVRADSAAQETARLNLDYATIRAPIAGRTGSLLIHEGNLVRTTSTEPLVTINQLRPIRVRFAVPAARLPDLQQARGGAHDVFARVADDTLPPMRGALSFMDNHVDSTTGTVALKAEFPNRDGRLWPGQYASVSLVLGVQADAIVVPAPAVLTGQQGTYVFVVNPDGTAVPQNVTVARTSDSIAVIAAGLRPGDQVVTDGQMRLTAGAKVDVKAGLQTVGEGGSKP
jgi:multidrug efflux system membrane fusion protein